MKTFITLGILAISKLAFAFTIPTTDILRTQGLLDAGRISPAGLPWTVGDNAQYNLDMGGFIQGTMNMVVREETTDGFWLDQDMELGFMGSQKIEILINKNTGAIMELIVNGQKQTPPDASKQEIVDSKEDNITVPAGNFDCVWVKILDHGTNEESEAWVNPSLVPVTGMIKNIGQSQMGQVVVELTGFERK